MRRPVAGALAALALAPALSGCIGGSVDVVASAPKKGNGLTISVSSKTAPFGGRDSLNYAILHDGERIHPPRGLGGTIDLDGSGLGSEFVPYADFVVANGDYTVTVGDDAGRTPVHVVKFVEYVYLKPYLRNDTFLVDLTLESASGGRPQDRVIAKGEAHLDIQYRGREGEKNQTAHDVTAVTNPDRTFTRISFPIEEMDHYKGEGYYSVHVTFDNFQAKGNFGVGLDPVLRDGEPPQHWVYIEGKKDDESGPLPPPPSS